MKIIVQNLAVEYEDSGSGPVILFLHGWQDSLRTWSSLLPAFEKAGKRVVRVDLPGFGGSEIPKKPWSVGDYASFVNDFSLKLHLDVACLVGHSFGGRISIKGVGTGVLHPKKLVLIGSAGIREPLTFRARLVRFSAKAVKYILRAPLLNRFRDRLRKKMYARLGSDYYAAGPLVETYRAVISEDLQVYAKQITLPTLLIYGAADKETPVAYGEKFRSLIAGSKLIVLPDAGHFVQREKAEEVAALILAFL